ncbi:MAG TPA: alkaline phosphatase [Anaeromyxobacteraceae bacterium]|nr:alkaline phosphatase [Anaeromyxobacteraceae bacterium]
MKVSGRSVRVAVAALAAALSMPALPLPASVAVIPPSGARFLEGQRFDIRVEGRGTGPFSATLAIDGVNVAFTSGAQNSLDTDGISPEGWGGFNVRGQVISKPGTHTLSATFSDSTGTVASSSTIRVLEVHASSHGARRASVKNIIIMLGDGMGIAHRTAARIVKYGVSGGDPNGMLEMDKFPGTGLVSTHSLDSIVTDSAPGMACYTTGNHFKNSQEGVYPANVTNPFYQPRVEYLAEYLHRAKGTSLGLVTTADVEDATPAANIVHTGNRKAGTGICDQYFDERSNSGLAVLLGGGRRWFQPRDPAHPYSSRSASSDYGPMPLDLLAGWSLPPSAAGAADPTRDLIAEFQGAGFTYVEDWTRLALLKASPPDRLLGLFGYGNMNVAVDKVAKRRNPRRRGVVDDYHAPDQPMLDEMTEVARKVLRKNRNGFFLMVEGAHIDKQSHLMDAERVIDEVIEFDAAVGVARRFAESSRDTVVLVLADHECSGFSLIGALTVTPTAAAGLPDEHLPSSDPTVVPAHQPVVGTSDEAGFPAYAIAPDGYPATLDVKGKVLVGYGAGADRYETWLSEPLPVVDALLPDALKVELGKAGYADEGMHYLRKSDARGLFMRGNVSDYEALHTATDVPVSAFSSGSDLWKEFVGVQTNTDIFFKLARAALPPHGESRVQAAKMTKTGR